MLCAKEGRDLRKEIHRNKYIAEIIFRKTNKTRTIKQVSSRLQQLAGTSKDERIISIILHGYVNEAVVVSLISTDPPFPAPLAELGFNSRTVQILVTVMSNSAPYPSLAPEVTLGMSPQSIRLQTMTAFQPCTRLRDGMDPTIILLSPVQLMLYSTWEVSRENKPYWTASTILKPDGICEGKYRYITSIAGDLWKWPECIDWTILHLLFRCEDVPNYPFAEIMYTFESFISEPKMVPNSSKNPFRYIHMVCPPSRPTPESTFFPGTPLPKKEDVPLIPGTFIEENIALILTKRTRKLTRKSPKSSPHASPHVYSRFSAAMFRPENSIAVTPAHIVHLDGQCS
ncbi:hypothetical protein B0H11DRAFT_2414112 [Mycena galericulata]|nr:hypothetical protein B0H11DRAFT_2414112 [Mycena galericulata]